MGIADLLERPASGADNSGTVSDEFLTNSEPGQLAADPTPGRPKRTGRAAAAKPTGKPKGTTASTAGRPAMAAELAEELEMYGGLLALSWSVRDPVCAPVLSQQSHEIAVSLAVLISRSERLLAVMHGGGLLADLVRLAHALAPVVIVFRGHHMTRTQEEGPDDGGTDGLGAYPAFRPAGAQL
jgi:hypothetical protein